MDDKQSSSIVTDWFNDQVTRTSFGDGISRELARADLKLKPGEYISLMIISAVGMGFLGYFLAGGILGMIIGAAVGIFLPRFYVKRQQSKRLVRFNEQLSDMLNLMVNGLRAGYSTMQAMEAVSKELPAPICDEFRRVVQEMQLGVSMQVSLENLLRRIPSEDLDLVITAINVQREVGGNLAEILDTISYTIRERVRDQRRNPGIDHAGYVFRPVPIDFTASRYLTALLPQPALYDGIFQPTKQFFAPLWLYRFSLRRRTHYFRVCRNEQAGRY